MDGTNKSFVGEDEKRDDLIFYVVANAISGPTSMGGNTKIFLEFARRWRTWGNVINVITSEDGFKTCRRYGERALIDAE